MVGSETSTGKGSDAWAVQQVPPRTLLGAAIGPKRASWWLIGAAVVSLAWLVGRDVWSPVDPAGFGRVHFEWFSDVLSFWIFGVPSCLVAAWLLGSRHRALRALGLLAVAWTAVGLAVMAFDASFAGICFDSGRDTCVVTRPAHFAHLLAPLLVMALGAAITIFRQRRTTAHPVTGAEAAPAR